MRVPKIWIGVGVVGVLILVNVAIGVYAFRAPAHSLSVSFMDVGQGDAILITGPTGMQVLIDGGPDKSVVRELPKRMGPLDRHIDLMVETHPDKDHIAGLPEVLRLYDVDSFMSPGLNADTNVYAQLVDSLSREPGVVAYVARAGMRIHLGEGAYADVLYPNKDVSKLQATNDASIALHVVYGDTSFLVTGDMPATIEEELVRTLPQSDLTSDVLKAGHHGSKYSTSATFLEAVAPRTVVISAGAKNTYGHPAPEVLARVKDAGATLYSTIESGTITFVSDGKEVVRK